MEIKTAIENFIYDAHEKGAFTGTWLFAENGNIISKGAIGWRDAADALPIQEDSLFDIASISKQFTATAIMLLCRKGIVNLDDPVTKFFPDIPHKKVTVRNLLNCTSGLPDYLKWVEKTAMEEKTIPGNEIIVRFLCESGQDALFEPGEKWSYCNIGFCLAAQIVEKVSGMPFDVYMKENIFEPMGMYSTRIIHRRKDKLEVENMAYGLVLDGGRYVLPDDTNDRKNAIYLDGLSGDGLVYTNIFDLFKWDRMLREEKILTKEEQQLMYTPTRLNNGEIAGTQKEKDGYGFAWGILRDPEYGLVVDHSAGWAGYSAWFERFIDDDKVLIWLNCRDYTDIRAFNSFDAGMRAIIRGKKPEPIKAIEDIAYKNQDKTKWGSFCGKYEHPEGSNLIIDEICMKDGNLYAKAIDEYGEWGFRLYQIGDKEYGRKGGMLKLTFEEDCLKFNGITCKRIG